MCVARLEEILTRLQYDDYTLIISNKKSKKSHISFADNLKDAVQYYERSHRAFDVQTGGIMEV